MKGKKDANFLVEGQEGCHFINQRTSGEQLQHSPETAWGLHLMGEFKEQKLLLKKPKLTFYNTLDAC